MADSTEKSLSELITLAKRIEMLALAIASQNPPNWKRPLKGYKEGWVKAIDGFVLHKDEYGPTVVWWAGHKYTRRTGQNAKYGAAIWFSRPDGRDDEGNPMYVRLITFAEGEVEAEPLPDYVIQALG